MAVLKPRERLVYFRISEEEFHQFTGLCEQEGARSVSDLARSAVKRLLADCNRQREDNEFAPRIAQLDKLIAEVKTQLESLAMMQARGVSVDGNGATGQDSAEGNASNQLRQKEESYGTAS